jgi:hypothetical protein
MSSDEILYHYTTQSGYLGILKDGAIRASSILHLNDSSEFSYATELAANLAVTSGDKTERSGAVRGVLSVLREIMDVFVVSFSADGDQLGQWRAYCRDGGGISIGFDAKGLRELASQQEYLLHECSYDRAEHIKQLQPVVDEIVNAVSPLAEPRHNFLINMSQLAPRFKHPSCAAEREWRLVTLQPNNPVVTDDVEFREGKSFLIPFRKFVLTSDSHPKLPIREVIVGPTPHTALAIRSARSCLRKAGVSDARVQASTTPYRSW